MKMKGTDMESVRLKFLEGHETLILIVIYKPQNLESDNGKLLWDEIVQGSRNENVISIEDFNFNQIEWSNLTVNLESSDVLEMAQDCFSKQLCQK